MRYLRTTITGIIAITLMALNTQAKDEVQLEGAQVGKWTMDYDAAVKLAGERDLPLILNFTGSDWCGWCKLMDKSVFSKRDWQNFAAENALLVTLDYPKDKSIVPKKYVARNNKLKNQFAVRGFPTYVILESDGNTRIGQLAASRDKTPKSFISEFKGLLKTSEAGIAAYIKENPDKADAFKEVIAQVNVSKQKLNDWIATRPERNEKNIGLFEKHKKKIQSATNELDRF
jgi:protein disulfide-isomerase